MELGDKIGDLELVWNPTPDNENGIKCGDAFCFIGGPEKNRFFVKEYGYSPQLIKRYHILHNFIGRRLFHENVQLSDGSPVRCLHLPSLKNSRIAPVLPSTSCAIRLSYVEGGRVDAKSIEEITRCLRIAVKALKIQRIQGANCHRQIDGTILITDVSWDIPTFLLDNPSGDKNLDSLVQRTQLYASDIIYRVYPQIRD